MSFLGHFRKRYPADPGSFSGGVPEANDPPFRSTARTHVGKVRTVNEDRFVDRPDAGLWVIADGMGGHRAGDVAAEMVVEALQECIAEGRVTAESVTNGVRRVNGDLVEASARRGDHEISGSTVVALIARDEQYECLWVGDSRAYLYRDGRCEQITRDHSVVQELVDAGLVVPADAQHHPKAHILTRALGVSGLLGLDQIEGRLEPGDILLLCSDGLSDLLDQGEIEACLRHDDIEDMADALLAAALDAGARDNISLVLIQPRANP